MERKILLLIIVSLLVTTGTCTALAEEEEYTVEDLGRDLYFDTDLSAPVGMSCASCHDPDAGFADPDNDLPVSQGILPERYGNRNSPTSAYATYSPQFDEDNYIGGQFWDGRADNLTEQAKGPFLNPLEMHNPNKMEVVKKIKNSDYAVHFEHFSKIDLSYMSEQNVEDAYNFAAFAIAEYESSDEVNKFSSEYDRVGPEGLSGAAREGYGIFAEYCAGCHSDTSLTDKGDVFTTYTYHNMGTPRNEDNPFYDVISKFNPDGDAFTDLGLGGYLKLESENGKMKVPTLRNIDKTAPYMHNGKFNTLEEVVTFLNTPIEERADPAEVDNDVEHIYEYEGSGLVRLTGEEEANLVAFLRTLTDE